MNQDKILKKWLADELTSSELHEFKKTEDYDLNVEIIESAKYFKVSNVPSVKSFDEFKTSLKQKNRPVIQLSKYKILYKIAALFIIGFSLYLLFFNNNLTTEETLASNKITFELPDASVVTLNASSKVVYSKKDWIDRRELTLEGEAFFKVAKGSKFEVKTSDGIVSVLGTQFTVNQRNDYFEVKCFEGIVSVTNNTGRTKRLTKGKTMRVLNGITTIDTTNDDSPEWLNNISNFKSVPLSVVIEELERQYNLVIFAKNLNTNRLFTGGFIHNDLEQALTSILTPLNISYKKEGSNKIIFYKQE